MTVSLLDRGGHSVEVRTRVTREGRTGTITELGEPVTVRRVTVQPVSVSETTAVDITSETVYKVIGRGPWPGDINAEVTVLNGAAAGVYEQRGDTLHYESSPRTRHFTAYMIRKATA